MESHVEAFDQHVRGNHAVNVRDAGVNQRPGMSPETAVTRTRLGM